MFVLEDYGKGYNDIILESVICIFKFFEWNKLCKREFSLSVLMR